MSIYYNIKHPFKSSPGNFGPMFPWLIIKRLFIEYLTFPKQASFKKNGH